MILKVFCTILLFSSAAMAQGQVFYIPQVAAGSAAGLRIETLVTLVNLGTGVLNPAQVDIETFGQDGSPLSLLKRTTLSGVDAVSLLQREIDGRGTASVEAYSEDGSLQVGWAKLTTADNVAVEVIYSIFGASGDLMTTTSILPRAGITEGTSLIDLNAGSGLNSSVAVLGAPSNEDTAVVTAQVYDQFGVSLGQAEISLAPGEGIAKSWTELVPGLNGLGANGFIGTAEITATAPVFFLPLRQDGVQLTTRDILSARTTQ